MVKIFVRCSCRVVMFKFKILKIILSYVGIINRISAETHF
jgi:hypothetical protein